MSNKTSRQVHRIRERRVKGRTALLNQIRGLLAEYGLIIPLKRNAVRRQLPRILEDSDNGLTALAREFVADLYEELQGLDQAVERYDAKIERLFKGSPVCQRLAKVEGVGPVTATALVAAGDAKAFHNGRQMAAWLGSFRGNTGAAARTCYSGSANAAIPTCARS